MNYYVKRLGQSVFTYLSVITISFVIIRYLPGGPMAYIKANYIQSGMDTSQEEINALVEAYISVQPDKPLWIQYFDYIWSVLHLDLGTSITYQQPVVDVLLPALPWTMFLSAVTMLLRFVISISVGAAMAYREGSRFDTGTTVFGFLSSSIPYYIVAIAFLLVFAYQLQWFPNGGRVNYDIPPGVNLAFMKSVLYHAALPIASVVVTGWGGKAITMRANSVRVIEEDYIRVAKLRGIPEHRVALRYVARNAILPLYTNQLMALAGIFSGSVILETIFQYPGTGYYLFRATVSRDYPLMMAGFLFLTFAVLVGVLLGDLTYSLIDPRIQGGESRESY